jgi:hypothetical protein
MNIEMIVKQLANRINQPHVIETYLRKVFEKGIIHGKAAGLYDTKVFLPPNDNPYFNCAVVVGNCGRPLVFDWGDNTWYELKTGNPTDPPSHWRYPDPIVVKNKIINKFK